MDVLAKMSANNQIDPNEFDLTVNALLVGLGGEKYVDIFRKRNIGQCTLVELTDDDLIKLGVDDIEIRQKLLNEVKNLPVYEDAEEQTATNLQLGPLEIIEVLENTSQHIHRIYLSTLANTLAVKKTKKIPDYLLYKDQYSSDIALATLDEITTILNSMDITLHTKFKVYAQPKSSLMKKKIIVGTVGGIVVTILSVMLVQSLRNLKL